MLIWQLSYRSSWFVCLSVFFLFINVMFALAQLSQRCFFFFFFFFQMSSKQVRISRLASVSVRPRPRLGCLSCTFRSFYQRRVAIGAAAHWNPVDVFSNDIAKQLLFFLYSTSLCNRSLYSTLICKVRGGCFFQESGMLRSALFVVKCSEVLDVKLRGLAPSIRCSQFFSGLTV